jgi:hypothetical protein
MVEIEDPSTLVDYDWKQYYATITLSRLAALPTMICSNYAKSGLDSKPSVDWLEAGLERGEQRDSTSRDDSI